MRVERMKFRLEHEFGFGFVCVEQMWLLKNTEYFMLYARRDGPPEVSAFLEVEADCGLDEVVEALLALGLCRPAFSSVVISGASWTDAQKEALNTTGTTKWRLEFIESSREESFEIAASAVLAHDGYLVFADTRKRLPVNAVEAVRNTLTDPNVALGGIRRTLHAPLLLRYLDGFFDALVSFVLPLVFCPRLFLFRNLRILRASSLVFCRTREFESVGHTRKDGAPLNAGLCVRMSKFLPGGVKVVQGIAAEDVLKGRQWCLRTLIDCAVSEVLQTAASLMRC